MIHPTTACVREGQPVYVSKGWKARFACPECGRKANYHLNFLGRRVVICDGRVLATVPRNG